MLTTAKHTIVIPAKLGDHRIEDLPLQRFNRTTVIRHLVNEAHKCGADSVVVATDSHCVACHVEGLCDVVVVDDQRCWCGVSRAWLAARHAPSLFPAPEEPRFSVMVLPLTVPGIRSTSIELLSTSIRVACDPRRIVTLYNPLSFEEGSRHDFVKVRVSKKRCVKFTRSRVMPSKQWYKHIGVWCMASPAFHAVGQAAVTREAADAGVAQFAWSSGVEIRGVRCDANVTPVFSQENLEKVSVRLDSA